ncbi:MAG: NAD(P)-dependent oxidoreductase [Alkalinema sp. RU_4_3]|nr:NAD(P)-dependent oxidoreductase [Alkalinema sp. RU_4_3]
MHQFFSHEKLLITGASGFLGWHVCQITQTHWQVHGTYHSHPVAIPGVAMHGIDLTDDPALRTFLQELNPDAILHTAALSQPNACQDQPELSYCLNVQATWAIADHCAAAQIPYVFTSSEQVFDGNHSPYRETDRPTPLNLYGEHKLAAEMGVLDRYPAAAVCRMPLMYGVSPTAPSFIQPFIQRLRSGELLQAFTDEIRTPVSGFDAAKGLLIALEKVQGIIHLGGQERLSRYEMAQTLIEVLQIENAQIQPCLQAEVQMSAARPRDLSMDSAIAYSLGFHPQHFREVLTRLKI